MEARKAVAEKLKFEPEVAGFIQLEDGLRIFSRPAVVAFDLCVSLQERVDALEKALRTEWWGNHGCDPGVRYGDDGKMQCGVCITDFIKMPFNDLWKRVADLRLRAALSPKEGVK